MEVIAATRRVMEVKTKFPLSLRRRGRAARPVVIRGEVYWGEGAARYPVLRHMNSRAVCLNKGRLRLANIRKRECE